MDFSTAAYVASDRFRALLSGSDLPQSAVGSVLFADISGFTPLTERLRERLGNRRGAEALASALNRVYDALITEVDRYGGSILGFAGDAITCWFSGAASASRAAACGFALLTAMRAVERIDLPESEPLSLGLKVAITTGTTRRFLVGDPAIQRIDALAGAVVARVAVGEELAQRGDLLADAATVERLGDRVQIREWREADGERFAVLERLDPPVELTPPPSENITPTDESLLAPLLPPFARNLPAGVDAFQIELRPVAALFLRFTGIDYDADADAGEELDRLMRLVQQIVARYEGNVLQLTIGDKGSYLYAAFGAPYAHEDDPARALSAALDIRDQTAPLDSIAPVQIGISRGIVRTGAYGGTTRRTYGALGDEVNLAARLMQRAEPGTILISENMLGDRLERFALRSLDPMQVKGKAQAIRVFQVIEQRDRSFEERFYTTPLVGRDDLLAQLDDAFQPMFERRHAGISIIHGEAGMGKSRLVFEAQRRLQAQANVTWLIGQADQLNRAPLSAFTYFLRAYFGQQRERDAEANQAAFEGAFADLVAADEANRADLLTYRSFLAGVIGLIIPGSPYETADDKLRTDNGIAAVKTWARAASRRQPLVIQLEDAQWLDVSSVSAVQQLTYNMADVPLALVLTSRYNDDGSPLVISNIYSVPVHSFDLNRLSDDGLQTVAEAVLNGTVSERLARFVSQRAEGNPFFTEQLALDLKERGALIQTDNAWDIRPDAVADVPSGVNAVLIARLDRLAAQVKSVVQTAAVLGREFEVAVLSRMLRDAEMRAVQEAEREAIWTALDELRYLFRHALLRDAAYNMQAQERLKGLHQLAAETIEVLYPNDSSQDYVLVEHWHSADVLDKELQYLNRVARPLIEVQAQYQDALRLLNRALQALDPADSRRITLLNYMAHVARRIGDIDGSRTAAEEALKLARAANDQSGEAISLFWLGMVALVMGDYGAARIQFLEAIALQEALGQSVEVAAVLLQLGACMWHQGDFAAAQAYTEQCLQIYRSLDHRLGIIRSLNALGVLAVDREDFAQAQTYLQQSLTSAREMGDRAGISNASTNLGSMLVELHQFQSAKESFQESLAIDREMGSQSGVATDWISLGWVAENSGSYREALDYNQQGLAILRSLGERDTMGMALRNIGECLSHLGSFREGHATLTEALDVYRELGNMQGVSNVLITRAWTERERGLYKSARAHALEFLSFNYEFITPKQRAKVLIALSAVERDLGEYDQARAYCVQALSLAADDPLTTALVQQQRGEIELDQGRYTEARDLFAWSATLIEAQGFPYEALNCLYSQARLAWSEGHDAEAEREFLMLLAQARTPDSFLVPEILVWLARIALRQGQRAAAVDTWRQSVDLLLVDEGQRAKGLALLTAAEILLADGLRIRAGEVLDALLTYPSADALARREAERMRQAESSAVSAAQLDSTVNIDSLLNQLRTELH